RQTQAIRGASTARCHFSETSAGTASRRPASQEEGRREVIAHLVLLTPRPELTAAERATAIGVLARAAADVPEILRFKIGKRIRHGLPGYEQLPQASYEVVLMLEMQDVD